MEAFILIVRVEMTDGIASLKNSSGTEKKIILVAGENHR